MMDPPPSSIVKTFKYNSSMAQPMFRVVETPAPIHYRSSTTTTTYEDISFSSYLKPKPENLQEPRDQNPIDDTEISIFDAQKYFSEITDQKDMMTNNHNHNQPSSDMVSVPRLSSVSSADGYGPKYQTRSFRATPTASSEASWNSQTGLLANPPGSMGVSLKNFSSGDCKKPNSVARKWIFGRKCCCTGKKSVQVKEITPAEYMYGKRDSNRGKPQPTVSQRSSITSEIHQQKLVMSPKPIRVSSSDCNFPATEQDAPRQQRVSASGGFSFPILDTANQTSKSALKEIKTKLIVNPLEEPPRDSLEVFQPMSELPSVSRPAPLDINPAKGRQHLANTDDDAGSDASSDLFEIESFSTQTTSYPMYRRRDSLDEAPTFNARRFAAANGINLSNNKIDYGRRSLDEPPTPSVAATECYAPSEVSIDWSVTTAEGFDRASVSNFSISASEMGGAAFLRQRMQEEGSGKRRGNGGGGGLLLMSCRQDKAVSVGPQPVKCKSSDEDPPIFPIHVGGRPPRANKPPLGSDHSARLSLAFAA